MVLLFWSQQNKRTYFSFMTKKGEWSLDQISLDIFSWSKFSVNLGVSSKFFKFFFGQLIEFHLFFSVDQNFLKSFDQLPKFASYFLAVDQNFYKCHFEQKCQLIMKVSINWKMTISIKWFSVKQSPVQKNLVFKLPNIIFITFMWRI